jgi:predicted  nucleic acid-binding Zn-ribbon protein
VRETFHRVAERHEGEALAAVEVVNAKRNEYCCGGCNMSVTLQTVLAMRTLDQLQTCGSCGRILYLSASSGMRSVKS